MRNTLVATGLLVLALIGGTLFNRYRESLRPNFVKAELKKFKSLRPQGLSRPIAWGTGQSSSVDSFTWVAYSDKKGQAYVAVDKFSPENPKPARLIVGKLTNDAMIHEDFMRLFKEFRQKNTRVFRVVEVLN